MGKHSLDAVAARFASHVPKLDHSKRKMSAAVALVLRERSAEVEALLIRRAEHDGDPWSGDLAFPGGRIDPDDAGPRQAAERETLEELGLELACALPIGQLSDVLGHAESIRVSGFVYGIEGDPKLVPNYEVREAFWSPLAHFTDPGRQEVREFGYQEQSLPLPCVRLLEDARAPVLWGITYKFMDDFMKAIGDPIPYMPWAENDL